MSELSQHTSLRGDVYEAMFAQGIDGFGSTFPAEVTTALFSDGGCTRT